jgi:hypothetical protein
MSNVLPANKMTYNHDRDEYYFEYGNGRVLHVGGDSFVDAAHRIKLANTEAAYDAAREEALDPEYWELAALEVPKGKQLEDMPNFGQYDAWITG